MTRLSLRARLTLWYTLALLVVLALFGADVLWQQRRIGLRRVDRDFDIRRLARARVRASRRARPGEHRAPGRGGDHEQRD